MDKSKTFDATYKAKILCKSEVKELGKGITKNGHEKWNIPQNILVETKR